MIVKLSINSTLMIIYLNYLQNSLNDTIPKDSLEKNRNTFKILLEKKM